LYKVGYMFLVYGGKHSEKTPTTESAYAIIWGHYRHGYTESQSTLTNILMCDVGHLNIHHAYSLKNSSIPLFPNIPNDI
jgi:hypothetical protein